MHWQQNGIVLTALVTVAAVLLAVAERMLEDRAPGAIVIAIDAGAEGDDEGDERIQGSAATVPLYGSLVELEGRVRSLLAEPQPDAGLLHELARQARSFREYELADSLLARCLELAPQRIDSLFLRGRTQSDLDRPQAAIALYQAVLAQAPNHQKATYNLGVVWRRSGDYGRAQELLARAVAISSGRLKSKALHQQGLVHGATGDWDAAARSLREAVELRPDATRYWLDLGHVERQRDELDQAQVAYEKALALDKRSADAHEAMGVLYEQRGNRARANFHLNRAVRLNGADTGHRQALARHYLAAGDATKAREAFGWLARNSGNDADRAYAEAMLALLDDDTARMLERLKLADTLDPGAYDDAVGQAAIVLHERNRRQEARSLLVMLLARAAPPPEVMLAAARIASRLEQWADAEAQLHRYLRVRPQSSEAWFQLGRVLSERGDSGRAIDAYRSSLARKPDARNTRLNLAVLLARSGRQPEALALYDQLLESYPRYTPALINRARLHERSGRVSEALADLEAAARAAPEDSEVRERFAQLLLRQGQTDRARALLSEAVAASPADPEIRLLLAETELRAGRRADALKELRRAAVLAGNDARLWSRLARHYRDAGDMAAAAQASARAASRARVSTPSPKPS